MPILAVQNAIEKRMISIPARVLGRAIPLLRLLFRLGKLGGVAMRCSFDGFSQNRISAHDYARETDFSPRRIAFRAKGLILVLFLRNRVLNQTKTKKAPCKEDRRRLKVKKERILGSKVQGSDLPSGRDAQVAAKIAIPVAVDI
jgi:hypothetical protein